MARSKTPQRLADERALLRRYQSDLDKIRKEYIADLGKLHLDDEARALRIAAREAESDYKILSRKFRGEVSVLRKKGLVSKKTKAVQVRPTRYWQNLVNTFSNVVSGRSTTSKVSKEAARRLKDTGWIVKGDRVVHAPSYGVNRNTGELTKAKGGTVIASVRLDANVSQQVEVLHRNMGPNEYLTFEIYGHASNLFPNTDRGMASLKSALDAYDPAKIDEATIVYFQLRDEARQFYRDYNSMMINRRKEYDRIRRRRRTVKNAMRRAAGKG